MKGAFIFDLDGTLCDSSERVVKYLQNVDKPDWDAFYKDVSLDEEITPVCEVLNSLKNSWFDILFVTGRPESCRESTLEWLRQHFDNPDIANSDHLFMRSAEDGFRSDYVSKMRNYHQNIEGKWKVLGVFEDRNQCVRAWRDLGLVCFQVADGNY